MDGIATFGDFLFKLKKDRWILTKYIGKSSDVVFPDSFKYKDQIITEYSIGQKAFDHNFYINDLTISKNVVCFEDKSFYYCENIKNVYFNGTINDWMNIKIECTPLDGRVNFYHLNPLGNIEKNGNKYSEVEKVIFPDNITRINFWFHGFNKIKELIIPDTVKIIDGGAFDSCKSLEYIVLPKSLKKVGLGAFSLLDNLKDVYYNGTIEDWCNIEFDGFSNPMEEAKHFYILDENGNVDFLGKKYKLLTEITIPDNITTIGDYQFSGFKDLTKVVLPKNLTTIKDNSFKELINLTSIIIPETVTSIGDDVFRQCYRLVEIYDLTKSDYIVNYIRLHTTLVHHLIIIHKSLEEITILTQDKDYIYACVNGEGYIIKYKGNDKDIIIPDSFTYNDKKIIVNYINNYAFEKCDYIETVTIPNTVIEVFEGTFKECNNLKKVVLPSNIYEISESLFWKCKSLKEIIIPNNVKIIDNYAFKECESLTNVSFPEGLKVIRRSVFSGCSSLKNAKLPDSLTKIDEFAFNDCSLLENIKIPYNVIKIDSDAFSHCNLITDLEIKNPSIELRSSFSCCQSLKSIILPDTVISFTGTMFFECELLEDVIIPNNVKMIDTSMFAYCHKLKRIIIPDATTNISYRAFDGCKSLEYIILPKKLTKILDNAFKDCPSLTKVYYKGTFTTKEKIKISIGNDSITNATWYLFTRKGLKETMPGNWWYYDTDGITIIEKIIN